MAKDDKKVQAPMLFERGKRSFRHDLFKLKPAGMLKNQHWDINQPNLIKVEHCHFFHSVDRVGNPMKKTTSVGGHYHEVSYDMNALGPDGKPTIKVGPPIKIGVKELPDGRRIRSAVPIKWSKIVTRGDAQDYEETVDNHTHEIEYMGSDVLVERRSQPVSEEMKMALGLVEPSKHIEGVRITE